MQYELFYLIGERQEPKLDEIKEGVNAILALESATMVGDELTEKRKLAYEIKHQNRGTYITRRFELPETDYWADQANAEKEFGIEAITKKLNLVSDVLRFMIVKTSDLPELGAKEKRQQREQADKSSAKPEARPSRDQRRPMTVPRVTERSIPAQPKVAPAVAAPAEKVEQPEKKEEVKAVEKEATKGKKEQKDAKDIDKQLEELLNI